MSLEKPRNPCSAAAVVWLLGLGLTAAAAQAAPRKRPATGLHKVVVAKGSQVSPAAARLAGGTQLLAFERLLTAHRRRVYVQRRRPRRGWSWARALPLSRGDYTQRDPTLVVRKKDEVLLYVQVGDLRRRRAAVRVYRAQGDSFRWTDAGRLPLGLGPKGVAGKLVLTQPFASPDRAGGVLLTVTRRFAGARDGCHLTRAADGVRFGPLLRLGSGTRCRVVATGPSRLVLTYQTRARRRLPWRSYLRLSTDGGKTWSKARPVSALQRSSEAHPFVSPAGTLRVLFVVTLPRGSAIQSATWIGARRAERRLTRPGRRRDITPFGLHTPQGRLVLFARESQPLDFDVLGLWRGLKSPAPRR